MVDLLVGMMLIDFLADSGHLRWVRFSLWPPHRKRWYRWAGSNDYEKCRMFIEFFSIFHNASIYNPTNFLPSLFILLKFHFFHQTYHRLIWHCTLRLSPSRRNTLSILKQGLKNCGECLNLQTKFELKNWNRYQSHNRWNSHIHIFLTNLTYSVFILF